MCICDSKKTKTVPESMRGRIGGSLLPLLFFFLYPLTPFSLLLLFSFWLYLLSPSFFSHLSPFFHPLLSPTPVSIHPFPLIYVVMIVVNTIHTFVLLKDGNLICWWPSVTYMPTLPIYAVVYRIFKSSTAYRF